jgi:branched-chain amino acid aminotransferase
LLSELVAINGEVYKPSEAKISVFDRGFLYGDSVYEVARRYDGVFFALEDHIERMFYSASRIDLNLQMSERDVLAEIYRVAHESDLANAYMRIIITRGQSEGPSGVNLDPYSSDNVNRVIYIRKLDGIVNLENYKKGIDVITARVERNSKRALDPNIKSGNYLNNIMALGEAKRAKVNDAILINKDGFVTEGTTWNFYYVKNGEVISAPDDADILRGITRKKIKALCEANGIRFIEKYFTPDDVYKSEEVFASGSVKEITPIRALDGHTFNTPGPVTLKLMNSYKELVQNYCTAWRARYP